MWAQHILEQDVFTSSSCCDCSMLTLYKGSSTLRNSNGIGKMPVLQRHVAMVSFCSVTTEIVLADIPHRETQRIGTAGSRLLLACICYLTLIEAQMVQPMGTHSYSGHEIVLWPQIICLAVTKLIYLDQLF